MRLHDHTLIPSIFIALLSLVDCTRQCQLDHYPNHKDDCKMNSLLQYKEIYDLGITAADRPNEPKKIDMLTVTEWSPKGHPDRAITWVNPNTGERHSFKYEEFYNALDVTDEIIYEYEFFCFTKTRVCRCYMFQLHDAALVIRASDKTKGITVGDFWKQVKGRWGNRFWECDHTHLEAVDWQKPGVYVGWFGS